jgi:hypothetical protein
VSGNYTKSIFLITQLKVNKMETKIGSLVIANNGYKYEVKGCLGKEPIIGYSYVMVGYSITLRATVVDKDGNIAEREWRR